MLTKIAEAGGLDVVAQGAGLGVLFRLLRSALVAENGALLPGISIHESGGARMGERAQDSVLNKYCQCWDADNVFVTDAACFPSAGYQNHTLTIMTNTVRVCDFILREYFKGSR